jgi:hypothetical protein
MATTSKSEKILIGIGDEIIELTGADKEAFLADREAAAKASALLETARLEKETARASALNKLATIAGLTEEELNSII